MWMKGKQATPWRPAQGIGGMGRRFHPHGSLRDAGAGRHGTSRVHVNPLLGTAVNKPPEAQ